MSGLLALPQRPNEIVARWIVEQGLEYAREVPIKGFRVDFAIDWKHLIVLLEVDEKQHLGYDLQREISRTNAILDGLNEMYQADTHRKPILIVRFNPDSYLRVEETKNPTLERRLTVLGLFIDQYQQAQPIKCAYFCYNTDLLCNLSCPFLAGNERLKLIAFPILADPDAVAQLPEKQIKTQLRSQRKLKNIDPRDQYIETLRQELKDMNECAVKLREEVKAAKRRFATEDNLVSPSENSKPEAGLPIRPTQGTGGIYLKHRKRQGACYTIQFWTPLGLKCFYLAKHLIPDMNDRVHVVDIIRSESKKLGLTDEAVNRSLSRLQLLNTNATQIRID